MIPAGFAGKQLEDANRGAHMPHSNLREERQIQSIHRERGKRDHHLYQRLESILHSHLWKLPNLQKLVVRKLDQLVDDGLGDEAIYDQMHTYFVQTIKPQKPPIKNKAWRENRRTEELTKLVPAGVRVVLDFGCAEGKITGALGLRSRLIFCPPFPHNPNPACLSFSQRKTCGFRRKTCTAVMCDRYRR